MRNDLIEGIAFAFLKLLITGGFFKNKSVIKNITKHLIAVYKRLGSYKEFKKFSKCFRRGLVMRLLAAPTIEGVCNLVRKSLSIRRIGRTGRLLYLIAVKACPKGRSINCIALGWTVIYGP